MRLQFILFALIFPICAFSQVKLGNGTDVVKPNSSLKILKLDREVDSNEVLQLKDQFFQSSDFIPNLGLSKFNVWLSLIVENNGRSSSYLLDIAYPLLDEVELYELDSTGQLVTIAQLGGNKNFEERKYQHANYIFDLDIEPSERKELFLRVKSSEQIILPLSIATPVSIWEKLLEDNILVGLYLGVVIIMSIYNLFLFISVRDYSYFFYVIYVLFLGLTQLGIVGFNFQYLWPGYPEWERVSIIFFACISSIAVLFFTSNFLNVKRNAPLARWLLFGLLFLFLFSFVCTAFGYVQFGFQIMQTATTLESIVLFVLSLWVLQKGYQPAKYFFAAWAVLLIGALIFLFKDYGILPYNLFTSNSFRFASIVEMALLSFALAARINILKQQKEESQSRELAISQENERLIREQNIVLEQKVNERTRELTQSNESLQTTLTHLKDTQSQLVEAEKMASLGQLTAGVAHEINNPINFVTSNVAPLKRDIKMVWDTLDEIERIAFSEDLSVKQKQEQIQAYKEELDIDYLKEEVDFLLKGMHDGASRTAEIVKSLRIFSRVDEDTLKYADINEGLESTLVILGSIINEGMEVQKIYGDIPEIECYAGKLNQVFLNILTNAIYAIDKKFGRNFGGILKIQTSIYEDPSFISILISDNGIGIPSHIKEKIFEPFFTTKDVGEGTGLGMSIAYNTIAKHEGRIVVESEEGQGTIFNLIIPIKQDS
ncbi:sensor histidine kinase [Sphingobacterium paucimobilis]|uniref:histidine kinase n=1 Tax=Sphingobacterium paucimobilis HER1398 TaxID=1346330 RepID=U2JE95_9SPHI|nr:7TM diverse intracellular signaling domain-containing protein [Sphingobacterium paucimobilis]ERJ60998.1 hypothetical protein M472_19780 [Sphingobacterium paucimobilis HER1398]